MALNNKDYDKDIRKLKNRTLSEDILESLQDICQHLLNRNYLTASDAFLEMAIGNAPWLIGVRMVGIFSKNVAYVMNDETRRKYIQGLNRLMTKCQDPSKEGISLMFAILTARKNNEIVKVYEKGQPNTSDLSCKGCINEANISL
uniref:Pre-mRNA-splicing factor 18 n=1 Tax=Glossina palpalis gambiensis TaxID=67801 RepID=A0A1B0BP25_9MUSC